MPHGQIRILNPFTGLRKQKACKIREKYMPAQRRQHLVETGRESYYKEESLHKTLDSKGAFYKDNESDNDDESENKNNEHQQLWKGFANSC